MKVIFECSIQIEFLSDLKSYKRIALINNIIYTIYLLVYVTIYVFKNIQFNAFGLFCFQSISVSTM